MIEEVFVILVFGVGLFTGFCWGRHAPLLPGDGLARLSGACLA